MQRPQPHVGAVAIVESFNGKFREECLNAHWFESIEEAKEKIDAWSGRLLTDDECAPAWRIRTAACVSGHPCSL